MMKTKTFFRMVLLSFMVLIGSARADAYFVPAGLGVRPAALGGAYVAVADDANAVLFNPAGYAGLERMELVSMYSQLYTGFNARLFTGELDRTGYNFLSAAVPFGSKIGTVGLAWIQLDSLIYAENTYVLSYGRSLGFIPLDVGVNLKVLQWQVAENEFTAQNTFYPYSQFSKTGFTVDIGFKMYPIENLSVATSVENVVPVDMGLTRTEIIPMVVRAGAAYRLGFGSQYIDQLLISGQLDLREDYTDDILTPRLGLESTHAGLFAVRAGVALHDVSAGLGVFYQVPKTPLGLQLDYAFNYPFQLTGTSGSHRIGLKIQWDQHAAPKPPKSEKEAGPAGPVFGPWPAVTAIPVPAAVVPAPPVIPDKNPRKIVIGVDSALSNQKQAGLKIDLDYLLAFLNKRAKFPVVKRMLGSEELKKQFLLGEIDILVSYNEYYYELYQRDLVQPAIMIRSQGKPTFKYYLYVSQDSVVANKEQLKGRRLGCLTSEKMKYLKTIMYPDLPAFDESKYFSRIITFQTPMEAVLALQMGTVDALLGREQEYRLSEKHGGTQGIKIHGELKSIASSRPMPNIPVLVKQLGDKKKKAGFARIVKILLKAHQTQELQESLNKMGIDRIIPFQEKKYRNYLGGQ